jgi:hypothetical protein
VWSPRQQVGVRLRSSIVYGWTLGDDQPSLHEVVRRRASIDGASQGHLVIEADNSNTTNPSNVHLCLKGRPILGLLKRTLTCRAQTRQKWRIWIFGFLGSRSSTYGISSRTTEYGTKGVGDARRLRGFHCLIDSGIYRVARRSESYASASKRV